MLKRRFRAVRPNRRSVGRPDASPAGGEVASSLRLVQAFALPATVLLTLLVWEALIRITRIPSFILPAPLEVWSRFLLLLADGGLLKHLSATLVEVFGGLLIGLGVASGVGYLLAKSHVVERFLAPYIVASQSIPVVAIAPLLVIWFGPGRLSKVLIAALIVFFPVLVNTVVGIRSVPRELYDLMTSLRASTWQTFTKLEVPAALPVLLGGLKVGATLSVIGAVVGEFVGADEGLGFLINLGRGLYDTPLVFTAILVLVALAMSLYGTVAALERWLLRWREA